MALRVGSKRSRELPTRRRPADREPMVVDDSHELLMLREDSGADADREDGAEDGEDAEMGASMEQPRRKRAMVIRANIQFLQKLPPLANYQRGQFGRRGGVDGGPPDGDLGMLALEETMSDSSFSRVAIARAPTPVANGISGDGTSVDLQHPPQQHTHQQQQIHPQQIHHHQQQQQPDHRSPQVLNIRRNATPAFASRPQQQQPLELMRFHHRSGPVMWSNARKDDEARPATNDTRLG